MRARFCWCARTRPPPGRTSAPRAPLVHIQYDDFEFRMAGLRVASSVSLSSSHPVPAALHRRTVHRAPVRRTTTPVMKIDYVPAAEVRHAHVPRSSKRRERNGSAPHDHPVHLAARPGRLAQINIAGEAVARATLRSIDARR